MTTTTSPEPIVSEGIVIHCSAEEWQSPAWRGDVLALVADFARDQTWLPPTSMPRGDEPVESLVEVFSTRSRIEALLVAMRRCGWSASLHVTR